MTELLSILLFAPPLRQNLAPQPRFVQLLMEGLQSGRRLTLVSDPME